MSGARWKARLTPAAAGANTAPMNFSGGSAPGWQRLIACGTMAAGLSGLGACVNVNAPSEPIVIELNVNIKQEVLYRLVDSAEENIEENPEIF